MKEKPTVGVILLFLFCTSSVNFNNAKWKDKTVVDWDVTSYYSYLPATLIEKDITLKFYDKDPAFYGDHRFLPKKCENGNYVIKTSMGMAVMYLPFFGLGHLEAKLFGWPQDGFSDPYQFWILFSSLFYITIGLYFLRKILLRYHPEKMTAFILFCILFGTNVFIYCSINGAMSHAHSFSLVCVFMFYSIKWLEKPSFKYSLIVGLIGGLIFLIRPINILLFLFLLLYGVNGFADIIERIKFFGKHFVHVILIGILCFLVFLPQMLYWKFITGHYFFNSYIGERFFFDNPHLIQGLFGFRKGWLLYTPIMIFSLAGLFYLRKHKNPFFFPTLIVFIIYTYVILSWWCWWYGGSFGMRAMIDIYPLLTISMGGFIGWLLNRKLKAKRIGISIMVFFIVLNLFQSLQYRWAIQHFDSNTAAAYFDAFFRIRKSPNQEKLIQKPDYDKARELGYE